MITRARRTTAWVIVALAALASPAVASANTVVEWDANAERALAQAGQQRGQPELPVLGTAMVQGAVYDAVNAIARTNQPYLVAPRARWWYSKDAAAATAAYRTSVALVPEQRSALEPLYAQSLAAIPDGPAKTGGIRVGEQAAAAMLAARENDGRDGPSKVMIGTEPGQWRPTPPAFALDPASWMGDVKPFLIPSAERLRTRGPNRLTSRAYTKEFIEVKEYGSKSSTARTDEQTDIALFWNRAPWSDIVRSLAQGQQLNAADTARLVAMVRLAAADAIIACRNDKYYWNFWRPITAIREAGGDGNPATKPDENWESLLDTPPYPDHPAGHTCGSAAIVGALRTFFGTDRMSFSATSSTSGTTRSFTSFSQALDEVIDSRVWGGVHFRTAEVQGAQLGFEVARWERAHYFKPMSR
jgi:PAP2 superfamily protein